MNKASENRLNELVEAINSGTVTYNGLVLARGAWSYHWDKRIGVNRLTISCEAPENDAISRIVIRNAEFIEVARQNEYCAAYIIFCKPEPRHEKEHIFNIEL